MNKGFLRNPERSALFSCSSGSRFKKEYHGEVQADGSILLVEDRVLDTQELIEKDAIGADLPSIIQRALSGDVSVFRSDEGFYGDITNLPTSYAEVLNTVNNAKREFYNLPIEVREKFDSDFEKWFATTGSDDWLSKMGFVKSDEIKPVPSADLNPVDTTVSA